MAEIVFERLALYEEVWSSPLTILGKKYGLSDNGLRKICKAMNIPLPKAGHWAKMAAGQQVPKPPLPKDADRTSFTCHPPEVHKDEESAEDQQWYGQRIAFEELPENKIVVDLTPKRWHPAVVALRDKYRTAAKEYESYRKRGEIRASKAKPQVRVTHPRPSWDEPSWKWRWFEASGQMLFDTHKASPLRVSLVTYERALAIVNGLAFEAEKRDFTLSVDVSAGRIKITGYGDSIPLRLSERLEDAWRTKDSSYGEQPGREKIKAPTGQLRLYVETSPFAGAEVSDGAEEQLEEKLNAVFVKIYRAVVRDRASARHWAKLEQERQEERRRWEEAERIRLEQLRQAEEEKRRRAALEAEARAWKTSVAIREYVGHVITCADAAKKSSALADWEKWALRVAEELDPTSTRLLK